MANPNIDDFVDYPKEYKERIANAKIQGDKLIGCCPFHDDINASFSVELTNGRWFCHAGCGKGNYMSFRAKQDFNDDTKAAYIGILKEYGMYKEIDTSAGNATTRHTWQTATENIVYCYHNPDGTEAYFKQRLKWADGKKSFPTFHIINGKKGKGKPLNTIQFYDLHILAQTHAENAILFVVEGEKCVEYAKSIGLLATTCSTGASSVKLSDTDKMVLTQYKNIVMIPDNDKAGEGYYSKLKEWLPTLAKLDLKTLWSKAANKQDIADYIAQYIKSNNGNPQPPCDDVRTKLYQNITEAAMKAIEQSKADTMANSLPATQEVGTLLEPDRKKLIAKLNGYIPKTPTYIDQAEIFTRKFAHCLRYCQEYGWIYYNQTNPNGAGYWQTEKDFILKARRAYQQLCKRQGEQWEDIVKVDYLREYIKANGGLIDISTPAKYRAELARFKRQIESLKNKGDRVLLEATAMASMSVDELDQNPYYLNTPRGIIDLTVGQEIDLSALTPAERAEKKKTMQCSLCTSRPPSMTGMDKWLQFINDITCGDGELADYMQLIAGEILIGKVHTEHLIIAYNKTGSNGKSTYFNTLFKVFGTYSCTIPAKVLCTSGNNLGIPHYMAELKGKRMLLLPELKRREQLEDDALKALTSTDEISACKKYHDPFHFTPSHTTILFTNHLPDIGSDDGGTKRRLQVIPFNAHFTESAANKNFATELYEQAGDYALQWAIEGATKLIKANFQITLPKAVLEATEQYFEKNDTIQEFLDDECVIDPNANSGAKALYSKYLAWCDEKRRQRISVITFNRNEFKDSLTEKGYVCNRKPAGMMWLGIGITCKEDTDVPSFSK